MAARVVTKDAPVRNGERWRATFDQGETRDYDGVVIANGHLSDPLMPKISGNFSGVAIHAKDYKSPDIFDGKRVLICGMGNTGCDIVVDAIHRAKSVLWSVRGGNHFVPKFLAGKPADEGNHKPRRFILPPGLRSMLHEPILRLLVGPPERFVLPKPKRAIHFSSAAGPSFLAIVTAPTFEDRARICATLIHSVGRDSASWMHRSATWMHGGSLNFVEGVTRCCESAPPTVTSLKTEPGSKTSVTARFVVSSGLTAAVSFAS